MLHGGVWPVRCEVDEATVPALRSPRLTTRHPAWPPARPATVPGSRSLVGTPHRRAVRSGGQTGCVPDPRSATAVVRSRPAPHAVTAATAQDPRAGPWESRTT